MSEHKVTKVEAPTDVVLDEAELQFDFGIKDGMVVVDFGRSVKWIGLPPDDAEEFARIMLRVAQQVRAGKKVATLSDS